MRDTQPMSGTLTLTLHDPSGAVLMRRTVHNLVTDAGRALVADLFAGKRVGAVKPRLVVGTGDDKPSADDVALKREVDGVDLTPEQVKSKAGKVTLTGRLPEREASQALVEAGISVTVGTDAPVLYNRVVFEVVNKAPNMQMTLTWNVDFSGGSR